MIADLRLRRAAPAPLRSAPASSALTLSPAAPIVGIDVGERALDLAIAAAGRIRLATLPLAGLEHCAGGAIAGLTSRLRAAAPELDAANAIALIDSPEAPRESVRARPGAPHPNGSRCIDRRLAAIVRRIKSARANPAPWLGLWLFPTPPRAWFVRCVRASDCPPHLAAFGRELFPNALGRPRHASDGPRGGQVFTRFMLAGFALFRALTATRATSFESYPDLVFRLWHNGAGFTPKRAGRRGALAARRAIIARLAPRHGLEIAAPDTLDHADAAILAICAAAARAAGAFVIIAEPGEGRFALPLDRDDHAAIGPDIVSAKSSMVDARLFPFKSG